MALNVKLKKNKQPESDGYHLHIRNGATYEFDTHGEGTIPAGTRGNPFENLLNIQLPQTKPRVVNEWVVPETTSHLTGELD